MQTGVLARMDAWTLDGQDGMSKEGGSLDCEYRRRLWECVSTEQSAFMHDEARKAGMEV